MRRRRSFRERCDRQKEWEQDPLHHTGRVLKRGQRAGRERKTLLGTDVVINSLRGEGVGRGTLGAGL